MTMDAKMVQGLVNHVLYGIDRVRDLNDEEMVVRCADSIIHRRGFSRPAEQYAEAIDAVVRDGHLSEETVERSMRHSEAELLGFLARVGQRLAAAMD